MLISVNIELPRSLYLNMQRAISGNIYRSVITATSAICAIESLAQGGTCQNFDRNARPIFSEFEIWPNPIFLGWQIF